MQSLKPPEGMFAVAKKMFKERLGATCGASEGRYEFDPAERNQLDEQTEGPLDRVVDADGPTLITAYEKRTEKMGGGTDFRRKTAKPRKVTAYLRANVEH